MNDYTDSMKLPDPMEPRQCKATARSGKRCKKPPIRGGFVCKNHGGAAPQVKEKARLRLQALVDPAITALSEVVQNAENDSDRVRAADSILDRTGFGKHQTVEVEDAKTILLKKLLELQTNNNDSGVLEIEE